MHRTNFALNKGESTLFRELQHPFSWELKVAEWISERWKQCPTCNASMIVIAKWTPIVMLGLIVLAAARFGLSDHVSNDPVLSAGGAVLAAVLARLVNEPISVAVKRPRPFELLGITPLLGHDRGDGFPSNHATGAFALAVSMSGVPGYSCLLYFLAVLLCVSRLYTGLHFPTDIVAGALHGSFIACVLLWLATMVPTAMI
jgi:undecaprenyl-diphosphatase